jgi:hypothetical protein
VGGLGEVGGGWRRAGHGGSSSPARLMVAGGAQARERRWGRA